MSHMSKENTYCSRCGDHTSHVVVLVRDKSPFEDQKRQKLKEFIAGLIKGWAVGPFFAAMDDLTRHMICESCGTKTVQKDQ